MIGYMNSHHVDEFTCELLPGDRTTSYRMALQLDWPLRRRTNQEIEVNKKGNWCCICSSEWKETCCYQHCYWSHSRAVLASEFSNMCHPLCSFHFMLYSLI